MFFVAQLLVFPSQIGERERDKREGQCNQIIQPVSVLHLEKNPQGSLHAARVWRTDQSSQQLKHEANVRNKQSPNKKQMILRRKQVFRESFK